MKFRNALMVGVAVLLLGCKETRYEQSGLMNESALVENLIHTPARHDLTLRPTMDMDGDIGLKLVTIDVPEKYGVLFKCQHGNFVIQGSHESDKNLWKKFTIGDSASIYYKENYRVVYEHNEPIEKALIDYDFIDAVKK